MSPRTRKIIAVGVGLVLSVVLLSSGATVWAAGGDLDTSFDPGTGAGGDVLTTAVQADGKIIIGGLFSTYNGTSRNRIARLNTDGSLDTSFDPGTGANSQVSTTVVQADGKIIIGGVFTSYNGTSRGGIARLNSDGSLDTSFDPGLGTILTFPVGPSVGGFVNTTTLQADGKIIIGGMFTSYNGTTRNSIARLNANGSLDTTFNPDEGATGAMGVPGDVATTAVQADGLVIIGGNFTTYDGTARSRIARLNTDGSLDTTFDPGTGASGFVNTTVVQADGKVLIGGAFTSYNGSDRNRIARLNTDGSLDASFDPGTGASSTVETSALQADGKIIIGGGFTTYNDTTRNNIARLNSNGSLDSSFNPGTGADNDVYTIAVQADGRIIIGGEFINYGGTSRSHIARLLAAPGAISFSSATYNVNEGGGSATITLKRTGGTDNRVVAKVTLADVTTSPADYRFTPGALDTSFNPGTGANDDVYETVMQADGRVVIGGAFTSYNSTTRNRIARLNTNGSLDMSFDPGTGANDDVYASAVQVDGKIIIGGDFSSYNGTTRNGIARLNANGSLDISFDPGTGASDSVLTTALQADGRVIIGGSFTTYNGTARNRIARLNTDGSLDTSFDPGTGANISLDTIAVQADGKIIIGGGFTSYNGATRNLIARLNLDGSLDTSFDPGTGPNASVLTTAVQADGKIILGGLFTTYNGIARNGVARLNTDGSLDTSFDPGTGADGIVYAAALQADGKIIIGGDFDTYNGTARKNIARLNTNGSLDASFDPGTGPNLNVLATAVQADGRVIVGGSFITYNGTSRSRVARVDGDLFVTWLPGDGADKTVTLPIADDTQDEPDETLTLTLTPLTGGATSGPNLTATLTILDNDLPATSITAVSGSGVYGSTATLTATLTSASVPVSGKTIGFKLNGTAVGMGTTDANGIATLAGVSVTGTNAGSYPGVVEAIFTGDASYASSNGTGPLTITKASTTTTVTSSVNPSGVGQSVTFTATVASSAGTPTGMVQFKIDGTNAGSPMALNGSGLAQLTTSALTAGTHPVTAEYSGSGNFATSDGSLSGGQVVTNQPTLAINNRIVTEGNAGTTNAMFTVTLSPASGQTVTVNYATANGTATASTDYSATSGTLTFNPGDTSKTITVLVNGDTGNEPDETFTVTLSAASNATIATAVGTGTITNDDMPTLQFQQAAYSLSENSTQVVVTVSRSGDSSQAITVDYVTADLSASERSDYIYAAGTLDFAAGETAKTINVLINEDTVTEPVETLNVLLSGPTGGAVLGTVTTATIEITDDSDSNTGNAIDDAENFVRQQYHDFLNRDPDASGLAFWTSEITSCGTNQQCIEVKRINVSAAFFLSIEFQETGYLVERLYKAAYGDASGTSTLGGVHQLPVPLVRLHEFLRDTQEIGKGVVILQPGWEQLLENNKQNFTAEFVQRPSFTSALPPSLTAAQFVDTLNANAGNPLSQPERDQLVGSLTSGGMTRAQVLRAIAEDPDLASAEVNRAFALMQFFGYLRRNPNDPQDTDYTGYDFWLSKLNQFNGNFVQAEMVKAFVTSIEYRQRFGP